MYSFNNLQLEKYNMTKCNIFYNTPLAFKKNGEIQLGEMPLYKTNMCSNIFVYLIIIKY